MAVERQMKQLARAGLTGLAFELAVDREASERQRPTVVDVPAPVLGGERR